MKNLLQNFPVIEVFSLLVSQIPSSLTHNIVLQGIFSVMICNYRLFTGRGKKLIVCLKP